jgi:hypothetical protein
MDTDNADCVSVIGNCNHGYHLHCISTWLKSKSMCPLDNNRWEYRKHSESCNCTQKITKTPKNNNNNSNISEVIDISSDENEED